MPAVHLTASASTPGVVKRIYINADGSSSELEKGLSLAGPHRSCLNNSGAYNLIDLLLFKLLFRRCGFMGGRV
ncbi:hypothetical protein ACOMHN_036262 [Nucella lapillus]